jgi:hypothetical protein
MGLYCFHLKSVSCDLRDRRWFDTDAAAFDHAMGLLTPGVWVDVSERSRHVASLWGEASGFPAMIAPRPQRWARAELVAIQG